MFILYISIEVSSLNTVIFQVYMYVHYLQFAQVKQHSNVTTQNPFLAKARSWSPQETHLIAQPSEMKPHTKSGYCEQLK